MCKHGHLIYKSLRVSTQNFSVETDGFRRKIPDFNISTIKRAIIQTEVRSQDWAKFTVNFFTNVYLGWKDKSAILHTYQKGSIQTKQLGGKANRKHSI